jgi:hypothetical protein
VETKGAPDSIVKTPPEHMLEEMKDQATVPEEEQEKQTEQDTIKQQEAISEIQPQKRDKNTSITIQPTQEQV